MPGIPHGTFGKIALPTKILERDVIKWKILVLIVELILGSVIITAKNVLVGRLIMFCARSAGSRSQAMHPAVSIVRLLRKVQKKRPVKRSNWL
jgi:hypothetical protein